MVRGVDSEALARRVKLAHGRYCWLLGSSKHAKRTGAVERSLRLALMAVRMWDRAVSLAMARHAAVPRFTGPPEVYPAADLGPVS